MPRFAANLTFLYTELPFLDRFAAAARDGFEAVEFTFPYAHDPVELRESQDAAGVRTVLFNAPPGNWNAGDRGLASLPARDREFAETIETALRYAVALGCPSVHVMAGVPGPGTALAESRARYEARLKTAANMAVGSDVNILIEPLNPRDMPGYLLSRQQDAHDIVARVGAPNLKVQMDLYHCQIVEGDLATNLKKYASKAGHMQIAGVPERHEPSTGEVNYPYLFDLIDELGYEGWIGCEYRPRAGTSPGLDWVRKYLLRTSTT